MKNRILYTKPSITEREIALAEEAAREAWGPKCYTYIARFEQMFAAHVGVKHALATSSCTGALHMGLSALGIQRGDEVVLADTNWVATVSPIVHLGATPVFVDIDPTSWCIDPRRVREALTTRTRAIVATHIYGNLCDMDELLAIGERAGVPVIEDAAEALGSLYHGRRAGSLGRFATFSFHGSKTITTGEGGMFVTDDTGLFERVLTLSNHGRARGQKRQFWPDVIGFKYKMSDLQAAIGIAQMERVDELLRRKKDILARYRARLLPSAKLAMNPEPVDGENGAWMPTVVFARETGVTRETAMAAFREQDIDARVFFSPLSQLSMFADQPENLVAYDIPERAINLPSYHDMSCDDIDRVCAIVKTLVDEQ